MADLCMFGWVAYDEGGPWFVDASVRTITNARRVGVRLQSTCATAHRHARGNTSNTIEEEKRTGTWVHHVAQAIEEHLKEDQQELKTREWKRTVEDARRPRRIVHETTRTSY